MKKRSFVVFFLLLMMAFMPMTASAKGAKSPYKDVTRKRVDAQSIDAISYIKSYDGWRGLIRKGRFYPNRYMTRREFLIVLHNLYGDRITATMDDVRHANDKVTSKFACDRMVALSKALGSPIRWNGTKDKLRRKDVARYIKIFAVFKPAFTPKR